MDNANYFFMLMVISYGFFTISVDVGLGIATLIFGITAVIFELNIVSHSKSKTHSEGKK